MKSDGGCFDCGEPRTADHIVICFSCWLQLLVDYSDHEVRFWIDKAPPEWHIRALQEFYEYRAALMSSLAIR